MTHRSPMFAESNGNRQHQEDYTLKIGHEAMQIILIDNGNALPSFMTIKFSQLQNLPQLKDKNPLDPGDHVLKHTESVTPGLTAASEMSASPPRRDHETQKLYNSHDLITYVLII